MPGRVGAALKSMNAMNYRKIANTLSWVLHPFLLPVYLMAVLLTMTAFAHYSTQVKFYLMWVVVLYAIVIPFLALGVLHSLGRISSFKVDNRRERWLPLAVGIVCYILCAITFAKIPSAIFLRKFMVAAACCEAMCLVVSLWWKISLHLTGMGAVVATCSSRSWSPSLPPERWPRHVSTSAVTTARRCWPDSAAVSWWPCWPYSSCKSGTRSISASAVCGRPERPPAARWQILRRGPSIPTTGCGL